MGIAALFAVIYSVYILVDTQMILGGSRHKQVQLDDYILGATVLYVDIISLFLKILQLLGKKKDDWLIFAYPHTYHTDLSMTFTIMTSKDI